MVPVAEMQGKLRAALDARQRSDTLILARTDAVAVEGLDAALDRAEAYLECGVDALFIEALRTPEQMDAACRRFAQRVPLLANMVEGGKTPVQAPTNWAGAAFASSSSPAAPRAPWRTRWPATTPACSQHGSTAPWRDRMLDFDGLNAVIGTERTAGAGPALRVRPGASESARAGSRETGPTATASHPQ